MMVTVTMTMIIHGHSDDDQDDFQTSKHSRLPWAGCLTCPDFVKSPLYLKFYKDICCTQNSTVQNKYLGV